MIWYKEDMRKKRKELSDRTYPEDRVNLSTGGEDKNN